MTSSTLDNTDDGLSRWGGLMVAFGAVFIVVAIVTFLLSGAVAPAGADAIETAQALSAGTGLLTFSAYLSIPADISLLVGAVLLASRSAKTRAAIASRVAWAGVAVATLLIVQYDFLLPRAFIPMAARVSEAPLVFEALYQTSNYTHSVGMFMTFMCFVGLFLQQAKGTVGRVVSKPVAIVATVAWSLGLIVAAGLILERPLIMLAPFILLGWLMVSFMAFRIARPSVSVGTSARDVVDVRS